MSPGRAKDEVNRPSPEPRAAPGGWWTALAAGLVLAAALAGSLPSWGIYFHADDFGMVQYYWPAPDRGFVDTLAIDFLSEQSIWGEPLHELRPVMAWTVRCSTWLSGTDPRGHHAVSIALHALASILVFVTARRAVGAGLWTAAFAGSLFAALPVHAEAIEWMAGRAESLMTVFLLWALTAYVAAARRPGWTVQSWTACLAFCLALFAKESAVPFVGVFVLWDVMVEGLDWRRLRSRFLHWVPYGAILGGYFLLRWYALPESLPGEAGRPVEQLMIFAGRQAFYLKALVWPRTPLPPPDGWFGIAAVTPGAIAVGSVVLAAMTAVVAAVLVRPKRFGRRFRLATFFGPAWYLATLLPTVVSYASERHLYVTAAGMCLALVCVPPLPWFARGWRRPVLAGLAAGVVVAGVVFLRAGLFEWRERGEVSRLMQVGIRESARRLPPGSRLLVVPVTGTYDAWVWQWALPFALQPPFTDRDLYRVHSVIETPNAYCCPIGKWWLRHREQVQRLVTDDATPSFLLYWDPRARLLRTREVGIGELRARLAGVRQRMGRAVHGGPPVDFDEGVLLIRSFGLYAGGPD